MSNLKQVQDDADMDMTPMIDCVFLLMIFFVLVIDLSQQDLEDLILPKAEFAVPDENPDEDRPIINITQDGRVVWKGRSQYDPILHGDNYKPILDMLLTFKETLPLEIDNEGPIKGLVNTPVLVRADKWTEWHYVGKVMEQCSQPAAAFWKLELALSEIDKEAKMFKNR